MKEENVNVQEDIELIENPISETTEVEQTKEQQSEKMFTESEVNAIVAKRLKKERAKHKEAERLSKLSEEDRVKEQLNIDRAAFESEKAEFLKEKMLTSCQKELINNNLPTEFANLLVTDSADSTNENIKAFKEQWNKSLESAVNERLKANSRVPKKETHEAEEITWEDVVENPKLLKRYNKQRNKK